jgi:hypothetical protein
VFAQRLLVFLRLFLLECFNNNLIFILFCDRTNIGTRVLKLLLEHVVRNFIKIYLYSLISQHFLI